MKRLMLAVLVALVAAQVPVVLAHPGHEHTILGTVSMVHENQIQVKATDGKTTMIVTVNEKTRVVRGIKTVKLDSIEAGERVVVTAIETTGKDGRPLMVAKDVRLGVGTASSR